MDDFESRLEHELSGLGRTPLAEPESVEQLRSRARRGRATRALGGVAAVAAAAAVVVGVVVVASNREPSDTHLRVAAPSFLLGDIDAVVLASSFDEHGARNPLPASLAAAVAGVPGVERVSGVVTTFTPIVNQSFGGPRTEPPRTPILFSYHQPDEIQLTGGRLPATANEMVVDADFLTRNDVAVGNIVDIQIRELSRRMQIVGTFALPGVDLKGIPLAAMAAEFQAPDLALDRIDVKLAPGAEAANVRDAIAAAIDNAYTVAPPSFVSIPDQRLAQLEIQHAYWALISTDPAERATAVDGPRDPNAEAAYERHRQESLSAELRVQNVTFLTSDTARLTYRVFYGGSPSPIVHAPQAGAAVRIDGVWKLTSQTVCALARARGLECPGAATPPAAPVRP